MMLDDALEQITLAIESNLFDELIVKSLLTNIDDDNIPNAITIVKAKCIQSLTDTTGETLFAWFRVLFYLASQIRDATNQSFALWCGGSYYFLNENYTEASRMLTNANYYIKNPVDPLHLHAAIHLTHAYVYHMQRKFQEAAEQLDAIPLRYHRHSHIQYYTGMLIQKSTSDLSPIDHNTCVEMITTLLQFYNSVSPKITTNPVPMPSDIVPTPTNTLQGAKHISIFEGKTGCSYASLFGAYLIGATHIKITDPYIAYFHQFKNLQSFISTINKYTDTSETVTVVLHTKKDDTPNANQDGQLHGIRTYAERKNISFDWVYEPNVHDRNIIIDYTRWKIILGRGLDIYQSFQRTKDNPMLHNLDLRGCRQCEITYLDDF